MTKAKEQEGDERPEQDAQTGPEHQTELEGQLAHDVERLTAEQDRIRTAMKGLQKLQRPGALLDFAKCEREVAGWKSSLGEQGLKDLGLQGTSDLLDEHLVAGKKRHRSSTGRKLKEACATAGLKLKVISREDPVELRIPPLAVRLNFDHGQAEFLFAKEPLGSCPVTPEDIIQNHTRIVRSLDSAFEPAEFFERCYEAYRMGLVVQGGKRGDRLELNDFLGHLAARLQPKKFLVNPVSGNYRGYSRGQFAYDVHRLRQARGLQQNGRRLNFGVATGTAASKKTRVIYMEDEYGQGEYKLNIFFTEAQ
ncbi:MAG: hypothetical protein P1V35_13900 [Planctomycetota bacterium]|nr:hypothetical protein [Planctomycetota bacterium]